MFKKRNMLWLVPLALLISFPIWKYPLASFLEPRGGYDSSFEEQNQDEHNFAMDKVVIYQDKEGVRTAEIRAETAYTSETPNEYILTSVDGDLFSESGEKIDVIAEEGIFNTDTRTLTLKTNVVIHRPDQEQKLFSDLLYYFDESRKLISPGDTRLVGKKIIIEGSSLDYDVATTQYEIGGRVHCTISQIEED